MSKSLGPKPLSTSLAGALLAAAVTLGGVTAPAAIATQVTSDASILFIDAPLKRCVATALGMPYDAPITPAHMDTLYKLACSEPQIADISPLRYATNLTLLSARSGTIRDISPIAGLEQLERLFLPANNIEDLTPLAGLTRLQHLDLSFNEVTNASPLRPLTQLESLTLTGQSPKRVAILGILRPYVARGMDNEVLGVGSLHEGSHFSEEGIIWTLGTSAAAHWEATITVGNATGTFSGSVHYELIDPAPARSAVAALFTDETKTVVAAATDSVSIESAKTLVRQLPGDGGLRDALLADIAHAVGLLQAAQRALDTLVDDDGAVPPTVTQKEVDAAKAALARLDPRHELAVRLSEAIARAQSALDSRNQDSPDAGDSITPDGGSSGDPSAQVNTSSPSDTRKLGTDDLANAGSSPVLQTLGTVGAGALIVGAVSALISARSSRRRAE